ncbi:MAG: serine/threonine-protein kinase [Clostridia bacterium]|jgi:serine/threonine protein kinase
MKKGEIIDGRYKIVKILGKGGMSVVYLAENIKSGSIWAIKEIFKIPEAKIDIRSEFNILEKLNHQALPRIFDIFEDEESFYIIEDYIDGLTLEAELKSIGNFEEEKVVQFAIELCDVLAYLHKIKPNPVIYRDMKPSNIILTGEGRIKLIDFGIAREYKNESSNDTVYIGTKGYAAPEQYGMGQTNEMTDIYNLGMTLHHLVTGKNPNDTDYIYKPIRCFKKELSDGFEQLIERCTAADPDERYSDIEELKRDIFIIQRNMNNDCKGIHLSGQNLFNNGVKALKKDNNSNIFMKDYKKLIISIFGSDEFAAEFGYIFAKLSELEVLIVNLNFEKQNLDLYLNLVPDMEKRYRDNIDFGLSYISKITTQKHLNPDILKGATIPASNLPNLCILIDDFNLKRNIKFGEPDLDLIIKAAYKKFDLIILSLGDTNDFKILKSAIENADFNIIATIANLDSMRSSQKKVLDVVENNDFQLEKFSFVAFEFKEDINLSRKNIKKVCYKSNFIGCINYNKERERFRNINNIYAKKHFHTLKKEYIKIFERLNIIERNQIIK